jgi:hypothetical protein
MVPWYHGTMDHWYHGYNGYNGYNGYYGTHGTHVVPMVPCYHGTPLFFIPSKLPMRHHFSAWDTSLFPRTCFCLDLPPMPRGPGPGPGPWAHVPMGLNDGPHGAHGAHGPMDSMDSIIFAAQGPERNSSRAFAMKFDWKLAMEPMAFFQVILMEPITFFP